MKKLLLFFAMVFFASSVFSQSKLTRDILEAKQILKVNGYSITGISNDSILTTVDSLKLITQYAVKKYVESLPDNFIPDGVTINAVGGSVDTATVIATKADLTGLGSGTVTGTGTDNYITMWNAAGTGIEDSPLYTNGTRLGVGTTTPTFILDLENSQGGKIARFKDSDSAYDGIILGGDTNGGWIGNDDFFSGQGIYLQNNINAYRFYNDGSEVMRLTPSGLGIGTASINAKLHVVSSGSTTGKSFYIQNNIGGNNFIVLDNGNTGLGLSNPTQKFHVNGNARISGALYDSNNSPGSANQKLISTVTGTDWVDDTAGSNLYANNGTLSGDRVVTMGANNLSFNGTGLVRFGGYGGGNNVGGTINYVAVYNTDGDFEEWPLSALSNNTYNSQTNSGVNLALVGTVLGAELNINGLTADPSPATSTTTIAIQTGAFSPKKITIDALFLQGMNSYNDGLSIVVAATSQAAQTASTDTVGEEFYWRETGNTGLIKMRKE
tara:strand:- start:33260 stop:34747 length:1488 start_codon:yes stop_codon:yes gene_type:complete